MRELRSPAPFLFLIYTSDAAAAAVQQQTEEPRQIPLRRFPRSEDNEH